MPASIKHYDTSQLNQFFRATTWNYHWIWVKVSDPCIPFTFRQKHFLTLRFANGKKGEREDYQGVISAPKLTRPHPMREGGNCFWAWGEAVIGWSLGGESVKINWGFSPLVRAWREKFEKNCYSMWKAVSKAAFKTAFSSISLSPFPFESESDNGYYILLRPLTFDHPNKFCTFPVC